MLINKWLVIDFLNSGAYQEWKGGFSLDLNDPEIMSDLFRDLQALPAGNPFTVFFSEKYSSAQRAKDSDVESIISLFFQPSYFLSNNQPVIFTGNKTPEHGRFLEKLSEKSRKQGLSLLVLETKSETSVDNSADQSAYEITSGNIDYDAIIESWLSKFLEGNNPGEIHFLLKKTAPSLVEVLNKLREKELKLHNTEHYKFVNLAWQNQTLIDKYKKELDAKIMAEESTQLYLSMQKKQTADNVEWYHHEYEILPTWYKRLGHVIKVLTGKRTFRSLFSDKVKKYKD